MTDKVTTYIFTGEAICKILAFGFIFNGKNSYLRSLSNIFDFVICIIALSDIHLGGELAKKLSKLKTLRIARVMRPLRLISRSEGLTLAITALTESVPPLINLVLFSFIFFFIFGVFGLSQFKGAYYDCIMDHIEEDHQTLIKTKYDCMDYGGD